MSRRERLRGREGTLEQRDTTGKKGDAEAGLGDRGPTVGREGLGSRIQVERRDGEPGPART